MLNKKFLIEECFGNCFQKLFTGVLMLPPFMKNESYTQDEQPLFSPISICTGIFD